MTATGEFPLAHTAPIGPLKLPQLYEEISARLRAEIVAGRWGAGARLPSERDLAQDLEVSRPSVREAIAELKNQGVLETRPGSGSFVAADALDLIAAREGSSDSADASPLALIQARLCYEPEVAALAAARGQRDSVAEALLDEMDTISAVDDAGQRLRWSEADRRFHQQIALMTGNAVIASVAGTAMEAMDQPLWRRLRDEGLSEPTHVRLYAAEHRFIYDAIVEGDPEGARLYAERHLQRVRRHMDL